MKQEIELLPNSILFNNDRLQVEENVNNIRNDIAKLNLQIVDLLHYRNLLLHEVEAKISKISGTKYFLGMASSEIEEEWNTYNFNSAKIRAVVKVIRKLFFDDSKEECRKWNCGELLFEYGNGIDGHIGFNFVNGSDQFDIYIPTSIDSHYYGRDLTDDIFLENNGCGEIVVGINLNNYMHKWVKSSLNIAKIKDYVIKLCSDYGNSVELERQKEIDKGMSNLGLIDDGINTEEKPEEHPTLIKLLKRYGFSNKLAF